MGRTKKRLEAAHGEYMRGVGCPPSDAPLAFLLWMDAAESGNPMRLLSAPLSKETYAARQMLFGLPTYRNFTANSQLQLTEGLLAKLGR